MPRTWFKMSLPSPSTPPMAPAIFAIKRAEGGTSSIIPRVLVTLGGAIAAALTVDVGLPGIDSTLAAMSPEGRLSPFMFGLTPVFTAFIVVELVALAVPRWRHLRVSGFRGRAMLSTSAIAVALVIVVTQSWLTASWLSVFLESPDGFQTQTGLLSRLTLSASLFGGVMVLLVLARLIDKHGLGNGFIVVLLGGMAREGIELFELVSTANVPAHFVAWLAVIVVATVGLVSALLRMRVRGDSSWTRFHLPTCGLIPLIWTTAIVAAGSRALTHAEPSAITEWFHTLATHVGSWSSVGVAAASAIGFSIVFSRSVRFDNSIRLVGESAKRSSSKAFWFATAISTVAIVGLAILHKLGTESLPVIVFDVLWLSIATAGLMDIVADVRARRRNNDLVAAWPVHRVQLTDAAMEALANVGIDSHARGLYVRKLFFFFAPFVPILIMVPSDHAATARDVLSNLFVQKPSSPSA